MKTVDLPDSHCSAAQASRSSGIVAPSLDAIVAFPTQVLRASTAATTPSPGKARKSVARSGDNPRSRAASTNALAK